MLLQINIIFLPTSYFYSFLECLTLCQRGFPLGNDTKIVAGKQKKVKKDFWVIGKLIYDIVFIIRKQLQRFHPHQNIWQNCLIFL